MVKRINSNIIKVSKLTICFNSNESVSVHVVTSKIWLLCYCVMTAGCVASNGHVVGGSSSGPSSVQPRQWSQHLTSSMGDRGASACSHLSDLQVTVVVMLELETNVHPKVCNHGEGPH